MIIKLSILDKKLLSNLWWIIRGDKRYKKILK